MISQQFVDWPLVFGTVLWAATLTMIAAGALFVVSWLTQDEDDRDVWEDNE